MKGIENEKKNLPIGRSILGSLLLLFSNMFDSKIGSSRFASTIEKNQTIKEGLEIPLFFLLL